MGCGASKPAHVEPVLTPSLDHKQNAVAAAAAAATTPNDSSRSTARADTATFPRQAVHEEQQQSYENHGGGAAAKHKLDWTSVHSGENGSSGGVTSHPPASVMTNPTSAATVALERDISGREDPQWKQLWNANKDLLLDPADVHAMLQDLMATFTNKLSETELLMLQRKVRSAVRNANASEPGKRKARKNSSVGSTNTGDSSASHIFQDSSQHDPRSVVEKYHLLTPNVLRSVLPRPPDPLSNLRNNLTLTKSPSNDSNKSLGSLASAADAAGNASSEIRTVETTFLLALYCSDTLWDRVADIAVQSAKTNDLEMDVNKQTIQKQKVQLENGQKTVSSSVPEPCNPTCDRPVEPPPGVGMHALSFLLGLALSKSFLLSAGCIRS
jgi:hypothetical protein